MFSCSRFDFAIGTIGLDPQAILNRGAIVDRHGTINNTLVESHCIRSSVSRRVLFIQKEIW